MSDEKIVDKSVKIPAIKFSACEPLIPLFAISPRAMDKSLAEAPKVPAIGAQYLKISSRGGDGGAAHRRRPKAAAFGIRFLKIDLHAIW